MVDERSRLGDWEADMVVGKGHHFPKSMPLNRVTPEQARDIVDLLNDRTRKCLGYPPKEASAGAMLEHGSVALMG